MEQGEYRGALEAAQRRIDVLQRELDQARIENPRIPPKGTSAIVLVLAGLGALGLFGAVVGLGAAYVLLHGLDGPRHQEEPEAPAEPTKSTIGASWYTGGNNEPIAKVDLNGDGNKDLISLFWRAPDDQPLYVAAIDRLTLDSIWVAGPFPSQWAGPHTHLVATEDYVVVTDSREMLHVFDSKTGLLLHDVALPGGASSACALAADPRLVGFGNWNPQSERILDLTAGVLRPLERGEKSTCAQEVADCKPGVARTPCRVEDPKALARAHSKDLQSAYYSTLLGDTRFTETFRREHIGTRDESFLLVSDAAGKHARWEMPAVREGDTLHIASAVENHLTDDAIVTFYQLSSGQFRLLARSNADGSELWSTLVAGAQEGSYTQLFIVDGEIFVYADHGVHAIDLHSGVERVVGMTI